MTRRDLRAWRARRAARGGGRRCRPAQSARRHRNRSSTGGESTPSDTGRAVLRRPPGRASTRRPRTAGVRRLRRRLAAQRRRSQGDARHLGRRRGADDGRAADRRDRDTTRSDRRSTPARPSSLTPANLTITVGFGPSLLRRALRARRASVPDLLATCPTFRNDVIDPAISGGDLCVQACSERPAGGVPRRSATSPASVAATSCCGGRSSASVARRRRASPRTTPRNLMGFKDGTNDIKAENAVDIEPLRVGRRRRRSAVDGRRQLPHRSPHPHADRVVGQHVARRAGAGHRARSAPAARRSVATTSSIPSTSTRPTPRATRSSTSMPTSVSPAPPLTAG